MRKLLGILAIVFGVCIYLYPAYQKWTLDSGTDAIIRNFEKEYGVDENTEDKSVYKTPVDSKIDTKDEKEKKKKMKYKNLYKEMKDYNDNLIKNCQKLVDAWSYSQTPVNLDELKSKDGAIGYIDIPDMDVKLPLYIGASEKNMALGAAVLSETSMPIGGESTNCVISGHRGYRGAPYFKDIELLKKGSKVYITNPWGKLTYMAYKIEVVSPSDVSSCLIQEGEDIITLLTCHPYMSHGRFRYLVYCKRCEDKKTETEIVDMIEKDKDESAENLSYAADVPVGNDYSEMIIKVEDFLRITVPILIFILVGIMWYRGRKSRK